MTPFDDSLQWKEEWANQPPASLKKKAHEGRWLGGGGDRAGPPYEMHNMSPCELHSHDIAIWAELFQCIRGWIL